ncbi:MAG: hypothetical protein JNL11_07830 [Bdellovibrionaceae bacterium]|nr:hypothetical protein [Pseudobdellovibrionaceae bacterium]
MRLELAQMSHNEELLEFYGRFPLENYIQLKLDRGRDFFKYYNIQSDQFISYILRDDNLTILGHVCFQIENVLIDGKITRIAWARDLRISPERKAILHWAEHTKSVFDEIRKIFSVDYFMTSLNMNEIVALNTFIRPRAQKRFMPRYFLYRKFDLVTLHGQFPFTYPPDSKLKIRRGNPNQADQYLDYLLKKNQSYAFSVYTDREGLTEMLDRWSSLSWEDFFIAFDSKDNIVGMMSSWSSAGVQDFIPLRYSLRAHNFRQFLKFGKMFSWSRTLTKPYHRIKIEAALNFRSLNHIFVDHPDVFHSLLWKAFDEARDNEFLVYARDRKNINLKPPLGWISAEQTYGLYCTILPDEDVPSFLHPSHEGLMTLETTRLI